MRCVNETLRPFSLSWELIAFRFASSVSTGSVRNEVAVGIFRLSFIRFASVPAGPRSGFSSPSAAAGAGAAPFEPSAAASTSAFTTLPPAPEPWIEPTSMPLSAAMRAATGETERDGVVVWLGD